jgi:sulfur-carrier protein
VKVRVRLFAVARELAGADEVEVELPSPGNAEQLRNALAEQVPALATVMRQVLLAVNSEYVQGETLIPAGAEIACIPPVSGG